MPRADPAGRRRDARVGGFDLAERPLERRDLGAQQPAPLDRIVARARLRLGGDVQRGRHLARVHARLERLARGARGDRADRRGALRHRGHERAAALVAGDQPLQLEALVDGADGVYVDADRVGHVAQAGKPLARGQLTVADTRAERPCELHADRHLGVAVDGDIVEVDLRLGRGVVNRWPAHI